MKESKTTDTQNKSNGMLRVRYTDELLSELNALASSTGLGKSEIVRLAVHEKCSNPSIVSPAVRSDMSKHIINILNAVNKTSPDEDIKECVKKEAMEICALLNS